MNGKKMKTLPLIRMLILGGLLAFNASVTARAQDGNGDAEERKMAVAKAFCGEHGLLATCIGSSAGSCASTMKPLVDACYGKKDRLNGKEISDSTEEGFRNCFWGEYLKRFSSRIQYTDECVGSTEGKSAIEPLPPHLESQTEPLHPLNEQSAKTGNSMF